MIKHLEIPMIAKCIMDSEGYERNLINFESLEDEQLLILNTDEIIELVGLQDCEGRALLAYNSKTELPKGTYGALLKYISSAPSAKILKQRRFDVYGILGGEIDYVLLGEIMDEFQ